MSTSTRYLVAQLGRDLTETKLSVLRGHVETDLDEDVRTAESLRSSPSRDIEGFVESSPFAEGCRRVAPIRDEEDDD